MAGGQRLLTGEHYSQFALLRRLFCV